MRFRKIFFGIILSFLCCLSSFLYFYFLCLFYSLLLPFFIQLSRSPLSVFYISSFLPSFLSFFTYFRNISTWTWSLARASNLTWFIAFHWSVLCKLFETPMFLLLPTNHSHRATVRKIDWWLLISSHLNDVLRKRSYVLCINGSSELSLLFIVKSCVRWLRYQRVCRSLFNSFAPNTKVTQSRVRLLSI